jgi:hypothetical protein
MIKRWNRVKTHLSSLDNRENSNLIPPGMRKNRSRKNEKILCTMKSRYSPT